MKEGDRGEKKIAREEIQSERGWSERRNRRAREKRNRPSGDVKKG